MEFIKTLKNLMSLLTKRQRRNFFIIVIIMIIAGAIESIGVTLFVPLMTMFMDDNFFYTNKYIVQIANALNIHSATTFMALTFLLLAIVYIFKNIFLVFQSFIQQKYISNNKSKFYQSMYAITMKKPYKYFILNAIGNITRNVYSDVTNLFTLLGLYITIITECFVCGILAIVLMLVDFRIAAILFVLLCLETIFINKIVKPTLVRAGIDNNKNYGGFYSNIIQSIQSIKEIKVFQKEEYFITKGKNLSEMLSITDRIHGVISSLPRMLIETITFCSIFILVAILIINGVDVKLIIPQLAAFGVAAVRLLPSVSRISSALNSSAYYKPSLNNILNVVNQDQEFGKIKETVKSDNEDYVGNILNIKKDGALNIKFNNKVELKHITFSYTEDTNILENVNMIVPYGKSVGIIGSSGAGKTTAVDILIGLLKPNEGEVLCDDINIEENIQSWLNKIGYIPQSTCLVNDDIKHNIAFGIKDEDISEERVWEVLKEAQLDEYVKSLPEGLNTPIGERGIRLSGGQRQRIGIARALYDDPPLLIFDEATSSLDNDTESALMDAINAFHNRKTMIIIAHRLTTIEKCDIVYKVENKRIELQ